MSTSFPDTNSFAVTHNRKTRARIDVDDTVLAVPPWAINREFSQIGQGQEQVNAADNVRFLPGIGWQMRPYQASVGNIHEKSALSDAIYADGAQISVPSGFTNKNQWRDVSGDVTGLTAVAGTSSSGDAFYRKEPGASDDWSTTSFHIADSFGTDSSGWTYNADLVAKGTSNHDWHNESLCLRVQETGFTLASLTAHREFYFSGPASLVKGIAGTGNYCVQFMGDGIATLFEKQPTNPRSDANGWYCVYAFRYAQPNDALTKGHYFEVHSKKVYNPARGICGVLAMVVGTSGAAQHITPGAIMRIDNGGAPELSCFRFNVPYDGSASVPETSGQPIRFKSRRDQRPKWQISRLKYPTTATLHDDPFNFPGSSYYLTSSKFRVTWIGDAPASTSVTIHTFDRNTAFTGTTPMTPSATGSYTDSDGRVWGGWAEYNCSVNMTDTQYQCDYVLAGDSWKTATIERVVYERDGVYMTISPGEISTEDFPLAGPFDVQIISQDTDCSHNTATFVIHDYDDDFGASLYKRAGQCVVIDTEYDGVDWTDPANEGKQSVLFRGYVASIDVTQGGKQSSPDGFDKHLPGSSYKIYRCNCNGVWQRASEQYAPFVYSFGQDFTVTAGVALPQGTPWKVTDVIRKVLGWMGFPPEMIDIPDLSTRLYPKNGADTSASTLNFGQNLLEFIQRLAKDYLYRILHFAENSGDGVDPTQWWGMWTIISIPRDPYSDLAYFSRFSPSGDLTPHMVSPHMLAAWPVKTVGGQDQLGSPLFEWSVKILPCQGNHVTVAAVGMSTQPTGNSPDALICTTWNFKSYDVDSRTPTADVNDLDYVGRAIPLSYADSALSTADGAKLINRILLNSLRGSKQLNGRAGLLLVTSNSDASQVRPRQLRIGDTSKFEGDRYMVRCNNIAIRKDTEQMSNLEMDYQREPL